MNHPEGYAPRELFAEKINIKDFKMHYLGEVPKSIWLSKNVVELGFQALGGSSSDFVRMEELCSIDKLNTHPYDLADVNYLMQNPLQRFITKDIDPDSELLTHKVLENRKKIKTSECKGYPWLTYKKPLKRDLKPLTEVLITVQVFRPFLHRRGRKYRPRPSLSQEFLVLGSQNLCELRDIIKCVADGPLMKEASENPDQKSTEIAKDKYKSGFFFIDGTFYNDERFPTNIDYSKPIREDLSRKNMTFKSKRMEDTTFIDLSVYLGHPYVYQHQGNCEHLIVFSDIRLLGPHDYLSSKMYPILNVMKNIRTRMCIVCGIFAASWLTKNNERVYTNMGYFCDTCFKSFNYIDGKKIGNFLAYPIYQH